MFQCEVQEVPCLDTEYHKFDDIAGKELISPPSVDEIINHSEFCTSIALDFIEQSDDRLTVNDYLSGLKGKVGVYHLWIEVGNCQDHNIYSLLCVYVGKGHAFNRLLCHTKERFPDCHQIYISFYECENRLAKYLEQLFLDTYNFYLNRSENPGTGSLFACWEEERFEMGTEIQTVADMLCKKWDGKPEDLLLSLEDSSEDTD